MNTIDYIIREVDPQGTDALALLRESAVEARELYPEFQRSDAPWPTNSPILPRGIYLVAYLDGAPVACGALRASEETVAEIRRVFVVRHMRRRGVGRAVLQALEAAAARFGYRLIWLETGNRDLPAMALYKSYGFMQIERFGENVGDPTSVFFEKAVGITDPFSPRLATLADLAEIKALMQAAIRKFIGPYLGPERTEASLDIMGLDTQLIEDATYFVVDCEGRIAGCGGWSRRATLFGGDHSKNRDARLLNPATEAARVRAMYTHPDFARRGVARLVLSMCEAAASREGFGSLELTATVSGEPLYLACGFSVVERIDVGTSKAVTVPGARMAKSLARYGGPVTG